MEKKWADRPRAATPPDCTGEVVYFGWDVDAGGVGTVICIGANYGQGDGEKGRVDTRAKLASWMRNYRHAAANVAGPHLDAWRLHGWANGSPPPLRPRYFIMTNVVPWITTVPWTSLRPEFAHGLARAREARTEPDHLDELAAALPDAFAVGHGVSPVTLPYVKAAARLWRGWMLYANLSFPQTPSRWDAQLERFVFGRKAGTRPSG